MKEKADCNILVRIWWDDPDDTHWLNANNVSLALHAYCKNTKFEVKEFPKMKELKMKGLLKELRDMVELHIEDSLIPREDPQAYTLSLIDSLEHKINKLLGAKRG